MNVKKNNFHKKFIILIITFIITITNFIPTINGNNKFNQDQPDQQQELGTIEIKIYNNTWASQSFKPTLDRLTRVELYLSRNGMIGGNITVSIRLLQTGKDETYISKPASIIPTNREWINFDFPDIPVIINGTYFIVCRTDLGDSNKYFNWIGSKDNPYDGGKGYNSSNEGISWYNSYQGEFDSRFITYGIKYGNETELEIEYLKGGMGGQISFGIKNTGNSLVNMTVNATVSGLVLIGKKYSRTFQNFPPGETREDLIYPVIGLGPTTVSLSVSTPTNYSVTKTKNGLLLLFYAYINPR